MTNKMDRLVGYGGNGENPLAFIYVGPGITIDQFLSRVPPSLQVHIINGVHKSLESADLGDLVATSQHLGEFAVVNQRLQEIKIGLIGLPDFMRYTMSTALSTYHNKGGDLGLACERNLCGL